MSGPLHVTWTLAAIHDLTHIRNHIGKDNPAAARRIATVILNHAASLSIFPERTRAGRIGGTREAVLPSLPYMIVYRVKRSTVEILRVLHTAQRWP